MFGYHVPNPDEALLITGKKNAEGESPYKVVTGHGAFVVPILRRVSTLTLAMQEAEVAEKCVTTQGIELQVQAVIAFKVGNDQKSIANAATRFLNEQDRMTALTGRIFAGHLRSIVGSMTVEDIIRERQKLSEQVLDASKPEMAELGLVVDSLQIQSIDDLESGYIANLAKPHRAAVEREANIAQAQADQASAEKRQESEANQAQYARDTEVKKAGYKAEVDKAQAQAAQAGPLSEAEAQQAVVDAQAELAVRNAELKKKELVATVEKPAEAEAFRIRTVADAEAHATQVQAEATATEQEVVLRRILVEKTPEIIAAAAKELAGANVTVLNGADGLGELVAGLGAQGGQLVKVIQDGLNQSVTPETAAPSTPETKATKASEAKPKDSGTPGKPGTPGGAELG